MLELTIIISPLSGGHPITQLSQNTGFVESSIDILVRTPVVFGYSRLFLFIYLFILRYAYVLYTRLRLAAIMGYPSCASYNLRTNGRLAKAAREQEVPFCTSRLGPHSCVEAGPPDGAWAVLSLPSVCGEQAVRHGRLIHLKYPQLSTCRHTRREQS